jgi:hypothetical protein
MEEQRDRYAFPINHGRVDFGGIVQPQELRMGACGAIILLEYAIISVIGLGSDEREEDEDEGGAHHSSLFTTLSEMIIVAAAGDRAKRSKRYFWQVFQKVSSVSSCMMDSRTAPIEMARQV